MRIETTRNRVLVVGLLVFSVLAGFGAAIGLMAVLNAVLPPFQIGDDDTAREYIPVARTYLTWSFTAVIVFAAGMRLMRRRRT